MLFFLGGAPFLLPFFTMLFVVGIPTFFLETAIGQFSGYYFLILYTDVAY